jgi:hypothetical protein
MDKKTQAKIVIYAVVILALGIGSYYYYNFLETTTADSEAVVEETLAKKIANRNLETGVLESQKFKDLQKINVEEEYLDSEGKATSTGSGIDVVSIPRRQSNPFKPF